jgi:predicted alpha/beta superfamily hydrolase
MPRFVALYPFRDGDRLTVRTEPDWAIDHEPVERSAGQATFDVALPPHTNVVQIKAVLHRDGVAHWALGANVVLRGSAEARVGHPLFFHGDGQITPKLTIPAPALGADLTARVFLPGGYDENPNKRYPVLYALDGANLFDPAEAFGGAEWQVDETLALLDRMSLIDKIMVVGVYSRGAQRHDDYTDPGYHASARALVESVIPFVDSTYRTSNERRHRALMGSSLGGVMALHTFWEHRDVFGAVAALSATFGYRDDLFARVARDEPPKGKIYLDSGYPLDNYEAVRKMSHALADRGADLRYVAHPRGLHSELHWADRLHLPLQFLFGDARH